MVTKRQSLGKGLDALLGLAEDINADQDLAKGGKPASDGGLKQIPVEFLQRGEYQPRRDFNSESLQELADSIVNQGLIQPIVVREIAQNKYEIIAGERRWRATQIAGLDTVPAIVREISDQAAIAMALIENIQREDLNPIEESQALIRLQDEFNLTQQQVAEAVGKSRSAVTNLMRLASLQPVVQQQLERGDIELGHAKCLLALEGETQIIAARSVAGDGLTVRQTEVLVKKMQSPDTGKKSITTPNQDIVNLQTELSEKLGAAVKIQHGSKGSGKLTISYNSVDELDGILNHLK
ncbi:MAG: putative chromosome-partitioning protein ParB [Cellvibrionales bacterium UBA7375]|nr:MAG: putative chromosome-partitioning protein ParB [Cellvibrionales bacterium UBA7375]